MTITVRSSNEEIMTLPIWVMKRLNLHDGEKITPIIEGQSLRFSPLEQFLSLRGVLRDDPDFDAVMDLLEQRWQTWTFPESV